MKIVIAEKVSPATLAVFQQEPGWQIVTADQIKNGLPAELADADALVVRSAVQVDSKLLESAPKLRVIGRAGVGVDNIDTDAATLGGIVVMNTPGANAVAVAELTLGLMVSMARSISRANATMHDGKWEKKTLQGRELRGKTLGIVGLGRIGLEVARRARAFGMELIGYDPFIAPVIARENDVTLVPIDEIFRRSDYLTLHVGLTPQTEGLINATSLAIMKKGVRIINCARGELIVEEALAEALKSGHVAGAALDVFRKEPLKESAFFSLDNVILSPHIAGSTDEAQEAIGIQLARQVRDYLKLGVVQNAVNLPSLTHEEYTEIAPYIDMAERLGQFLSHATPGNLENIQISYTGRLASGKTDLVRNAALAGIFAGSEGNNESHKAANRINAAAIAEERGVRVQEDKKEFATGGAGSVLKLVLHSSAGDASASATVLHGSSPRLLTYDGIDIEAPLTGTLLSIRNHDVPGVIGRIGTILGEHSINIANFALGRAQDPARGARSQRVPQGQALAVVQIDVPNAAAANAAIESLRKVEAIASVRLVELGKL
ncbi:phosphoglycerate dehydrogenase [Edaphobacter sp. 12200R-103]|jgi:D-3-phosphoglycerate dehydrogenase|uniref:phosphoglycerate dehydrogenase n=1 Tax=Edaphobacter sp. 12200R-103 TaxID=2703788 RepID=UPI00138D8B34|nr:phosphoglycerate dehydrogenase [Edaphobacter sp. 12200R-103]QHS52869.1 phosphoglycerate dehydrogenase [Edaphobacter sp. 12200R-103]